MTCFTKTFFNEIKNLRNPDFEINRKEIVKKTEMIKVAAAAAIIASALLFAAFPGLGFFCLLFPVAYAAYEIGTLSNNYQKTVEEWKASMKARWSDRQFLLHLTEKAPVSRSFMKINGLI